MDHGLPWGESPIDLEGDQRNGLGWTSAIVFSGSLMLVFLNSHAILNWANRLEVTQSSAPVIMTAEKWHKETGNLGLNTIVETIKIQASAFRQLNWSGNSKSNVEVANHNGDR